MNSNLSIEINFIRSIYEHLRILHYTKFVQYKKIDKRQKKRCKLIFPNNYENILVCLFERKALVFLGTNA